MTAGIIYNFTIDLSATPTSTGGIDPNSFCTMEVWGASSICSQEELLWVSPVVDHYGWETYDVSFTPTQDFPFLYFTCNCGPMGYILLDNVTTLFANDPNVILTSHSDGETVGCGMITVFGVITDAIVDSVVLTGNFAESPLLTTMNALDWSGQISFNGSGPQTITATGYYTDQQSNVDICVMAEVDLIVSSPLVDFNFSGQCDGVAIPFIDASVPIGNTTITSWSWDFGDGSTSDLQSPSHTYSGFNTYLVTLDITTSDGCSTSQTQNVGIYPDPVANFNFSEVCQGQVTDFTDASAVQGQGSIQTWQWAFGDGNSSLLQNPSNTFANTGVFPVTLTVIADNGCTNSITIDLNMDSAPIADFLITEACLNTDYQFQNQSSINSGSIVSWQWDFGDGNTSTAENPTYLYAMEGSYDVSLTVISDLACESSLTQPITVHPFPMANFTTDPICYGQVMAFINTSSLTLGNIDSYQWDFGDGELSGIANPAHMYSSEGTYLTSLVVTTDFGCQDSVTIEAIIYPTPVAEFNTDFGHCIETAVWFWDSSELVTLSTDQITTWNYTLGDGQFASSADYEHTYDSAGFYQVELIVSTNRGCVDSIAHEVEVYPRPEINWEVLDSSGCSPHSVQFNDMSTIPLPYTINQWEWNLGIGNSAYATIANPVFVYDLQNVAPFDSMTYDISLTVTSAQGCARSDTILEQITVHPSTEAFFSVNPNEITSIIDPVFEFTDLSTENSVYWTWVFGDGSVSYYQHPTHEYADTGRYTVDLFVETDKGCTDRIGYELIVQPIFTFYIPNAFTPNSDEINEAFNGQGTGFTSYNMTIHDRWGEMMFETNNPEVKWDGSYKGLLVEQGAYVYSFILIDWTGFQHRYVGEVIVLK